MGARELRTREGSSDFKISPWTLAPWLTVSAVFHPTQSLIILCFSYSLFHLDYQFFKNKNNMEHLLDFCVCVSNKILNLGGVSHN